MVIEDTDIDLSVIVPCFNEEGNIEELARRIHRALDGQTGKWELILVNDGSRDNTRQAIENVEKLYSNIKGCHHIQNQGIVAGWATGLDASSGRLVCTIDADLQYRPEDIPRMLEIIARGEVDLVQGWRKEHADSEKPRYGASLLFSLLLNIIFGMRLKDNKSGFILYKRKAMEAVLGLRRGFKYFQHFPTIAASSLGYKIAEIPVIFDKRRSGQSFIKSVFIFGLKSLLDFPLAIWRFRIVKHRL